MKLEDPIIDLNGVGEQTANKLHKLGIYQLQDMIEHYPREYEDRRKITPIADMIMEEDNNIIATLVTQPTIMKKGYKIIVEFRVKDATGSIFIVFFNQAYMKNNFAVGQSYNFYGKVKRQYGKIQMDSPEYQKIDEGHDILTHAKITPIYPITYKLSQKMIRQLIEKALQEGKPLLKDYLPDSIQKSYELVDKHYAVQNIHFPVDNEAFFAARKRLVFEELFLLQLSLYLLKSEFGQKSKGISKKVPKDFKMFIEHIPFTLTDAQKRVVKDIIQDMKSPFAGNRLVQGDVGSGKTVVAAIALFVVVRNGMQGALMVPTEVLAQQHYKFLQSLFEPFAIQVGVLTGSTTKKQKEILTRQIQTGELSILVGTHALLEDPVDFPQLGLVITDEQHRFGVRQRLKLSDKGHRPDVIVMTATPIPRTLALILYGDMDISVIDALPPGRQPIKTNAVDSAYHTRIYSFMRKHIADGRQCYVICPMVEESEKQSDLKSVVEHASYLQEQVFKGIPIGYLHGKMKPKEKNVIMEQFAAGELAVLVSTTVVEVGVNVPNATIMLIENAERFGLAQLHQLRGRVGRGEFQSYCVLISDSKNKITKERLEIMEKSTDGFVIADTDLKLRGPGEFFGTRQHGLPEMKIANLYTDASVLKQAQQAVKDLLKVDPYFTDESHKPLYNYIMGKISQEQMHKAL